MDINMPECDPCEDGIIINTAKKVCIMSNKVSTNKTCHNLYDSVVLGSMSTEKYLKSIKGICTEKQAKDALASLIDMLNKK